MTGNGRRWLARCHRAPALAVLAGVTLASCALPASRASDPAPQPPPLAPVGDYVRAVDAALADHLQVWIETDLVTRWEAGPQAFAAGIRRAAFLANRPGVAGIKIADELGYNDRMDSPGKIRRFLSAAAKALRAAAPHARILVDMVVPALGCVPGHQPPGSAAAACAARARTEYPQLALPRVTSYLKLHTIGVLDLSTGLLTADTYSAWGTTQDAAQRAAWQEVAKLGWSRLVYLQARKALAHPGSYRGTSGQAESDLRAFVDIPLAMGAHAADIWTWRQEYEGAMYRLMNPGLKPNALWVGLLRRRQAHDVLFTHLSPHSLEAGLRTDLAKVASVFTGIFLPAGTG